MSKPLGLSALFQLLGQQNPEHSSPVHFLFLLGTNTVFTPRPTLPARNYERGETLSYTAQTVATLLGEREQAELGAPDATLSFSSPSVDVLNGPDGRGTLVGERIADALLCSLRAAALGKKVLQLSGHSRGAVEGTLLIHELERIRRALRETPEKSLKDILIDSPCKLTRDALIARFQGDDVAGESVELKRRLSELLDGFEVNAFFIDPVPGDTVYGIPWITWDDPRFYQKLPCNRYEWLLCEDERSNCFFPIVPTDIKAESLPGHHGTLSGNRYSQQLASLPASAEYQDLNTTSVQDLVLGKWFHFVHKSTGAFPKPAVPIGLEQQHTELDAVLNRFLNADEDNRNLQLLEHYQKVAHDLPAYRYFRKTSYPVVGMAVGERSMHYQKRALTAMSAIAPAMPSGFVNERHAALFLDEYVQFSRRLSDDADVQLATIDCSLRQMIAEMRVGQGKLLDLMLSVQGERQFFDGLSILVDAISQKYLRNHLSVDEKKRLMDIIHIPFKRLAEVKAEEAFAFEPTIRRCEEVLQAGIKRTLETHYNRLKERCDTLDMQIQYFLAPEAQFVEAFKAYIDQLSVSDMVLNELLQEIQLNLRHLNPVTVETVKNGLAEALIRIQDSGALDAQQKQYLNAVMLGEQYQHLRLFVEAHEAPIAHYLAMFGELYQGADDLIQACPQLAPLLGEQKLDIEMRKVHLFKRIFIEHAGKLLKEKNYDLSLRPDNVSDSFYNLARADAVANGAILPEVLTLVSKNLEKSLKVEQLEEENEALRRFISKLSNPKERKAAHLIESILIPKTEKYLTHLINKARQSLPVKDDRARIRLNRIQDKHQKVQELLLTLSEKDELPSQLIANFEKKLTLHERDLKQNRDGSWTSYIKSCLALVAFVSTGILPGLAYGLITGRSPLFFAERRTTGAAYVRDAQRDLSSMA